MEDIEDDQELRANVNLYRDDDVIAALEAQMGQMTLDEKASNFDKDLKIGVTKVAGEERKVKAAKRKTAEGKNKQQLTEQQRAHFDKIQKANEKQKDEEDSDWESCEDDAPVIKLEELLDNLKIDDGEEKKGDDSEDY